MSLRTYTIEGRGEPERLLLLIHGFGANQFHLAALGPLIDPDATYLVVAPRGRVELSADSAAWIHPSERDDPAAFADGLARLDELLDEQCAHHGYARHEAVVGGFSQGAFLACALALLPDRPRPAGVLAVCGGLSDQTEVTDPASTPPVLIQAGDHDRIVTADSLATGARRLADAGAPVVYRSYPMAHAITLESLADARTWLARVTAGERPSDT